MISRKDSLSPFHTPFLVPTLSRASPVPYCRQILAEVFLQREELCCSLWRVRGECRGLSWWRPKGWILMLAIISRSSHYGRNFAGPGWGCLPQQCNLPENRVGGDRWFSFHYPKALNHYPSIVSRGTRPLTPIRSCLCGKCKYTPLVGPVLWADLGPPSLRQICWNPNTPDVRLHLIWISGLYTGNQVKNAVLSVDPNPTWLVSIWKGDIGT